jgi:aspartate/methionine/tyrosine aminotransferase
MDREFLLKIIDIVAPSGAYILCVEVYRGLDGAGNGFTDSIADLYEKGISTGSMSKAFSLAGLRLGWIVTGMAGILENAITHRDYTTISVGMLDDYFAAVALEAADAVLARSRRITRENRRILANWAEEEPAISWTPPQSGTTALLKYQCAVPSWDLCVRLVEETGVMLCPGSVMDMEGYVRIGYANNAAVLRRGLELFSGFLRKLT